MTPDNTRTFTQLGLAVLAIAFVLFVHGAIPFLMLPTLGQALWTTGFSASMANGPLFDFYARDFGIPEPAAIAFGLAGAWPASLLIRLGLQAVDAYAAMAAFWLGVAMLSAYLVARQFGATKIHSLFGSVVWVTMPVIWGHASYSMLSLGIALLSFYFMSACKLFVFEVYDIKIRLVTIILYVVAAIVSVFMDGYTFMMFAMGSSILLLYTVFTRAEHRQDLLKVAAPVHAISFALAYALYGFYIGKPSYEPQQLDFFRGWGVDLSFLVVPTKGMFWLPDLLGLSVKRTDERYFGDASVWVTTFALPILLVGVLSWVRARRHNKTVTGMLLVSVFAFYMALGPSLKINSTKPEALQLSHPQQQSALMPSLYAVAPTGNAWISSSLPGFNVMRASYRWSALGIFALWLLVVAAMSTADRKESAVWSGLLAVLFVLNMPDFGRRWRAGVDNRVMFQQIDQELVSELARKIRRDEVVAFLPWRNDFLVNYLAPTVGFRTFNIGGDKNFTAAQKRWPWEVLHLGGEIDFEKTKLSLKMLVDGTADAIVFPYFHTLKSSQLWPCVEKTTARLTKEAREVLLKSPGFICPSERRAELQPFIAALRASPYTDVAENDYFAVVRLRPEYADRASRLALSSSIIEHIQYPIFLEPGFEEAPYVLLDGWHGLEARHIWSSGKARLRLPVPKDCEVEACEARLIFGAFGASPERSVEVFFDSDDRDWTWSEKLTLRSEEAVAFNVPLGGAKGQRTIRISVPRATSPVLLTGSPDGRVLGISLHRIELRRVDSGE